MRLHTPFLLPHSLTPFLLPHSLTPVLLPYSLTPPTHLAPHLRHCPRAFALAMLLVLLAASYSSKGDPNGRLPGAAVSGLAFLALLVATFANGVILARLP